jgi:hypothetical protein
MPLRRVVSPQATSTGESSQEVESTDVTCGLSHAAVELPVARQVPEDDGVNVR